MREIPIIGDGNCAFNAFALADLNVIVSNKFDTNPSAQAKWKTLFGLPRK